MKVTNALLPATLLAFALVACQQVAENGAANDLNAAAPTDIEALPPSEEAGPPAPDTGADGTTATPEPGTAAVIPAQYHGRWGMVPADCTSTRGDAKGLIAIGDKTVKFYESLATLKEQRPAIATSFSGLFGFTGEGQTWEKIVTFTLDGDKLARADDDGRYAYTRCA